MAFKFNPLTAQLDKVSTKSAEITDLGTNYLKLDQSTPQTVTGGIPLLESTRVINANYQLVDKLYVDTILGDANALVYKGTLDCSTNPNYPAADAGHLYIVSIAGKIGGVSGISVDVGDMCVCNTDATASGDQATVGTKWNIIEKNIVGAVTGPTSATNLGIAGFDGVTGKLIKEITDLPTATTIGTKYIYRADGTDVAVADGGTGLSSYAVGDLLYASATTTIGKLADVAAGQVLVSGGVGAAPSYSASPTLTGLTLSGLTAGSIVFAGTSGVLSQDNANFYWDDTEKKLAITGSGQFSSIGIAIAPAGDAAVTITPTSTVTTGSYYAVNCIQFVNAGANSDGTYYGYRGGVRIQSGNTYDYTGSLRGVEANVQHLGTGTVTNLYGLFSTIVNTGTITNAYGLYIASITNSGTITNKYGIYQAGSGDLNYFAGKVGIGTPTPDAYLRVKGSSSNTTPLVNIGSGNAETDSTISSGYVIGVGMQPNVAVTGDSAFVYGGYMFAGATISTGKTLSRLAGMYVESCTKAGAGTVTDLYGLFIADQTGGTTNYSIYTGTAPSRFGGIVNTTESYQVDGVKVVGNRVVDARLDDTINSGDATTDGVIDALRDLVIAHGLGAVA